MTQDRVGGPQVPLTQEYLSVMLGVQRTTVTSICIALRDARLIGYRRGKITVVDRPALMAEACECYMVTAERQHSALGITAGNSI